MKRVENVCGPFFVSFPPFSFPYRNIILGIIGKDKKFQQIKHRLGTKKRRQIRIRERFKINGVILDSTSSTWRSA